MRDTRQCRNEAQTRAFAARAVPARLRGSGQWVLVIAWRCRLLSGASVMSVA